MSIVFIKLGGSLITNKREQESARKDVLDRLGVEIAAALKKDPSLRGRLIIGHGAGSFGHTYAAKYGIRAGCKNEEQWKGYTLTADAVGQLNRIVLDSLLKAGLPVWQIQPGASIMCRDGHIVEGPIDTVVAALERGLVPVVHGDMALDATRGGVVCSTEEVFGHLLERLPGATAGRRRPGRMVLAGEVDGIFTADPQVTPGAEPIPEITKASYEGFKAGFGGAHGVDVTGGMAKKVQQALQYSEDYSIDVIVCGGLVENNVTSALLKPSAKCPGTLVRADPSSVQNEENSSAGGCTIC
uniref:Isopentenyl phosphate kinase n=3 Tax=Heterosigma akashiwo TaxID=2829 RepID=A0A6T5PTT9_HETAK|mmetsp:Transcript_2910/g.4083  ORF Transcript_2910/g.4083 Transcript_2910/m.4083 type:complete len:299 (-) Transcript_2910:609-1505(-)|eukprot:CAMPEP_0194575370 /NCGR_PEP_ID=MMETSP0292-20121207/10875_1 /TAXON_ID=39354 /ORGANISM="Heterosigma akashiwo, Strain CCMP2393" /LENGTH=298 /DNA_ID=CAMNT_0039427131 /DNA_START=67 /DNA_END=963 /DNA_ORIENTATION=-